MTEIYRAGSQLAKVRAMMLLSLAAAVATCWFGWEMFRSHGLRPADGGVLAPLGERLAWGLGIASLGLAFALGMWLYGRLYVARLAYDEAAGAVHLRTLGFFGGRDRIVPVADLASSTWHDGRLATAHGHRVEAPWFTLRLRGRRLPLILDAQGEFPDPDLAARLLRLA